MGDRTVFSGNQPRLNRSAEAAAHPARWVSLLSWAPPNRVNRGGSSRWLFWLVLAGVLHAGTTLVTRDAQRFVYVSAGSNSLSAIAPTEIDLLEDDLKKPALAGGAVVAARDDVIAPKPAPNSVNQAAPAAHASGLESNHSSDENLSGRDAPESFPADLLAGDDNLTADAPRPRAARRKFLEDRARGESTTPDATGSGDSAGRSHPLSGAPTNTGRDLRGGDSPQWPAPTGLFRADVCLIEPTVTSLLDITICKPVATFFTDVLNVAPRHTAQGFPGLGTRTEWFAIKFRGKFTVQHEDAYTFRIRSDDGAIMEIDGRPILNNDGEHLPRSVSSNIRLDAGEHEFYVFYYQGPPDFIALQVFVTRFAHVEQLFGPAF